jgi:hypothetical protein
MKAISNRHFDMLVEKLPCILDMARRQDMTLRQSEDIRQLTLLHKQLKRKQHRIRKDGSKEIHTDKEIRRV